MRKQITANVKRLCAGGVLKHKCFTLKLNSYDN